MLGEAMRRVVLYRVQLQRDAERGAVGGRRAAQLDAWLGRLEGALGALRIDVEAAAIAGRGTSARAGRIEAAAAALLRELAKRGGRVPDAHRLGLWTRRLEGMLAGAPRWPNAGSEPPAASAGAAQGVAGGGEAAGVDAGTP